MKLCIDSLLMHVQECGLPLYTAIPKVKYMPFTNNFFNVCNEGFKNQHLKCGQPKNATCKPTVHSKNTEITFQGNNLTDSLLIAVSEQQFRKDVAPDIVLCHTLDLCSSKFSIKFCYGNLLSCLFPFLMLLNLHCSQAIYRIIN